MAKKNNKAIPTPYPARDILNGTVKTPEPSELFTKLKIHDGTDYFYSVMYTNLFIVFT